ncbi:MAG: Wzz/FepE/Etk N-terminal domain-containing protein [Clostridia bacterium]|nr:Wzz/FepE/Etk N-terminal domain-containing protein [Clostridia bacterium]
MEFTLYRLIKVLRNKLWLIILITVIFGISAFIISNFLITPIYQSTVSFEISSTNREDGSVDVAKSRSLKPEYRVYTVSNSFLLQVAEALNADANFDYYKEEIEVRDLKEYISVGTKDDASAEFNIIVTTKSPDVSFYIASEIQESANSYYKNSNNLKESNVTVIDPPKANNIPVSPNTVFNTIFGFILGLIFACLIVIIIESIDNSITDETDIVDFYEIPLLGVVYTHKTSGEMLDNVKKVIGVKS